MFCRRLARVCVAVAAVVALHAMPAAAQKKVTHRFAAPPDGFVRVYNAVGSVRVTGWDKDSVVVLGTVYPGSPDAFILGRSKEGTKLGVWDDDADAMKPSVLDVYVPRRSSVWVKTGSAATVVAGVEGSIDVTSTSGSIEVGGTPRDITAESMGGDIFLHADTRSARAKTAGSSIRLRGIMTDIVASTVSGTVVVEPGRYERARLESVDGDVRWFGPVERSASLEFVNHGGAVDLFIPASTWANITIDTFTGAVEQGFAAKLRSANSSIKAKQYTLTLGKGGPSIGIRTFKGPIRIRPKG